MLAAVLKKPILQSWLDMLEEFNLDPEVITLSGLPAALVQARQQEVLRQSQGFLNMGFSKATLFSIFPILRESVAIVENESSMR